MIKLSQIHVPVVHQESDILNACAKLLRIPVSGIHEYEILKKSIDARKKFNIGYSYSVAVSVDREKGFLQKGFEIYERKEYTYRIDGTAFLKNRPIVVGSGPAGLFCAYMLAMSGFRPIILERGPKMEDRIRAVEAFHNGEQLNPEANIQFGEGGAGTFSDGKLNTLIKDKDGKGRFVLQTFVKFGAPKEILYLNKPHIGTDILRNVIVNMREEIIRLGGEFRFGTRLTGINLQNGCLIGVNTTEEVLNSQLCVLAIGHSSRDTIKNLYEQGIMMEPKAYAMGIRIQHKASFINCVQYGDSFKDLPAADYKLTHTCADGRGVYSFCMCPGGYVVNASSEPGRLAINGMSNHARDAANSNSAIVVTVTPEDYQKAMHSDSPLCGMEYQRQLEEAAYASGKGNIPTQRYEDFKNDVASTEFGSVQPVTKGAVSYARLSDCLPKYIIDDVTEGIEAFDRMMPGFANGDALLSAIESRTSSPVRITRDECLQSVSVKGLYPCGEGAGYAGGITSAAMDGIRVFEAIIKEYRGLAED